MSQHLEEEEDEDSMSPPPRAGMVLAFSHLPVRDNPAPSTGTLRDDSPRGEIAPGPARSAAPTSPAPTSPAPSRMRDQDDPPPPEANSNHAPEDDTTTQDHADDRPWYMPRITAQDLPPQDHDGDAGRSSLNRPVRSSQFADTPPAGRSTSSTRDNGFSPSPQDLRDAFHAPTPDSPTREAPAENISPAPPRGRIFEKRLPPAWPPPQQRGKASTTRDDSQKPQDSGFGAAEHPSDRMPEEHLSISDEPENGGRSRAENANRRRRQTGEMTGTGTSSPRTFTQLAAPPATPKNKKYFVFPKNENVVILYNKKAVENPYFQFSSGTAMGQQGLNMLQDYSGSTLNPRLIDISDPGWVRKLDALAAANKDKGGFTHLVILDHGEFGNQHFGKFPGSYENETALTPESAAWRIITSVMAPDGHIHFGGCHVGKWQMGQDYLNELLRSLGKDSKITIDAVTGPMFNQSNQFEGDLIQAQPLP